MLSLAHYNSASNGFTNWIRGRETQTFQRKESDWQQEENNSFVFKLMRIHNEVVQRCKGTVAITPGKTWKVLQGIKIANAIESDFTSQWSHFSQSRSTHCSSALKNFWGTSSLRELVMAKAPLSRGEMSLFNMALLGTSIPAYKTPTNLRTVWLTVRYNWFPTSGLWPLHLPYC